MKAEHQFILSTEEKLLSNYPNLYLPFINAMNKGDLEVGEGIQLHYRYAMPENAKSIVVLMPGRSESVVKYAELCYQFVQSGYALLIYDHRGQGLSTRPSSNPQIGHVDKFTDYIDDAECVVKELVSTLFPAHLPVHLLAHSMGGAIGAGALIRMPEVFTSAVLCAPMIGINAPIPPAAASVIAKLGLFKEKLTRFSPSYFVGQTDFEVKAFEDNQLSSSKVRYDFFMQTHQEDSALQLGGIGNNWLIEALKLMQYVLDNANQIKIPVTVLRAMEEQIVDNDATKRMSTRLENGVLVDVPGARHEILFERDALRNIGLAHIVQTFAGDSTI